MTKHQKPGKKTKKKKATPKKKSQEMKVNITYLPMPPEKEEIGK